MMANWQFSCSPAELNLCETCKVVLAGGLLLLGEHNICRVARTQMKMEINRQLVNLPIFPIFQPLEDLFLSVLCWEIGNKKGPGKDMFANVP